MPKLKMRVETHTFKKGQKLHLDSIYNIQGIGCEMQHGGAWWEPDDDSGERVTVTRDITIRIEIS